MVRQLLSLLSFLLLTIPCQAQVSHGKDTTDNSADLMDMLNDEQEAAASPQRAYATATFKATRIINGHSVENDGKGVLDFRIAHRFGSLNQGAKNFYGLDNAVTKLAFDYGVTSWLSVGVGRSTLEKEYDGFLKAKIYRQTIDNRHPVSLAYVGAMSVQDMDAPEVPAGTKYYFSNRLFYVHQLLIARKFSSGFSLQLMPSVIHYNLVNTTAEPNNTLALGVGGRLKLSHRIAVTGEYYYRLPGNMLDGYRNSISMGIDVETGGHVFQLFFSNATGISERTFIGQTTGDFFKGDIHFGFNISRVFTIVRPKEFKGSANKIY